MGEKKVIPLAAHAPAVFYTVTIEHGLDGVRSIQIQDIVQTDENTRRVAAALREAADMLDPNPVVDDGISDCGCINTMLQCHEAPGCRLGIDKGKS